MSALQGAQFRWFHHDDALGDVWTGWHNAEGPCPTCCCGGPEEGEHQEADEYYDEDGILTNGHTRMDPRDIAEWTIVEWRTPE